MHFSKIFLFLPDLLLFLPVIAIFGRCHGRLRRWSFWGWTSSGPIWIWITGISRTNYGGTSCHFDFLQRKNTKVRHYLTAKHMVYMFVRMYIGRCTFSKTNIQWISTIIRGRGVQYSYQYIPGRAFTKTESLGTIVFMIFQIR